MAVIDTSLLILLFDPNAKALPDPATEKPVDFVVERLELLVATFEKSKEKLVVPAPVLSELLLKAGPAGPTYREILSRRPAFLVAPFDEICAVELAAMTIEAGEGKGLNETSTKAKLRFDRQIISIAKAHRQKVIFSDDGGIRSFAEKIGIEVVGLAQLPVPPAARQVSLGLPEPTIPQTEAESEEHDAAVEANDAAIPDPGEAKEEAAQPEPKRESGPAPEPQETEPELPLAAGQEKPEDIERKPDDGKRSDP